MSEKTEKIIFEISAIFLVVFSLFLITYQNDFITGQDALTYHLPVARYIAEHDKIPDYVPYDLYYQGNAKPPLLYIVTYPFFKIFGINEAVAEIVPFLFLTLWLVFLWFWVKKEGGKFEIFLFILLLSYFTVNLMTWYYQACAVVFFSTVAFYFWKKYAENREWKNLTFFVIFSGLAALSKITGAGLFAISVLYLLFHLVKKRDIKPIVFSLPIFLTVLFWYFLRNVKPPPMQIAAEHVVKGLAGHSYIWVFHLEMVLSISIFSAFFRTVEKSEREIFVFYLPLLLYLLYVSIDPRYPAFLSGFAIFFSAKYLSKIKFRLLTSRILLFGTLLIFLFNGIFTWANPQVKELAEIHSMKKACHYLRHELGIKEANVIGDADFGIGWWCRYNFTTMREYFAKNLRPFEISDTNFIVDSWWNFSASPVQNYSEYEDIEKIKKKCSLNLIWDDGENRIWKVVKCG